MATNTRSGDKPAKTITKPAAAAAIKTKAVKAPAKAASAGAKPVKQAAASKAPVVKKAPAAKTTKPAAAKKPAVSKKLAAEKHRYYIEVAAFYIAERRGFHGGSQLEDWVQAEAEIDRLLQEGVLKP